MGPRILVPLAMLTVLSGFSNSSRGKGMEDLVARVRRVEEAIGDLTWAGGLFRYPEFTEVHSRPEAHLDGALQALKSTSATEQQKIIVALSMQKLPLAAFLRFSGHALEYLEAGLISDKVFERAVFPTYDWNTLLAENYADPAVQRFLGRVLASAAVSERRKEIVRDEILTGNAKKDVLELRSAGEIK